MNWISKFDRDEQYSTQYQVFKPAPPLRSLIQYYWLIKCGAKAPISPELLTPDGYEEIIFSYDSQFERHSLHPSTEHMQLKMGSYFSGCKQASLICTRKTSLSMVGVKLRPGSLWRLFKIPQKEFRGMPCSIRLLKSQALNIAENKIYDAQRFETIKFVLDQTFTELYRTLTPHKLLDFTISNIVNSRKQLTVTNLCERASKSERSLQLLFREKIGLGPKSLVDIFRFKRLFHTLQRIEDLNAIHDELGIYDQSHMIKIFRKYTGTTPQRLFQQKHIERNMLMLCLDTDLK